MFFNSIFNYAHPEYLYLLVIIPLFFLFFILRLKRQEHLLKSYIKSLCLKSFNNFLSHKKRIYKYSMLLMVILFLILSLAQPRLKQQKQDIKITGSEVMIVADISKSMLVKDIGGMSRLNVMKKELNKLIKLLQGQRVGLIFFAGTAHLVSPLTLDHSVLKLFLKTMSPNISMFQGTNFGTALRRAHLALKNGSVVEDSRSNSKIIVVASDGENNEQQALQVAQKLHSQNIAIFTVGFGSHKGGMIPIYNQQKDIINYKKDLKGELVISRFKDTLLKKIAHKTGGKFYFYSLGAPTMKNIYSDIQNLGVDAFFYQSQNTHKQIYYYFVFIAFIFGILYFLIGEKNNKKSSQWHHYLEIKK